MSRLGRGRFAVGMVCLALGACGGSDAPAQKPDGAVVRADAQVPGPDGARGSDASGTDSAGIDAGAPDAGSVDAAAQPDTAISNDGSPGADGASSPDGLIDTAPAAKTDGAGPNLACGAGILEPAISGPTADKTDGDQTFRSLAVDPTDPNVLFVGSEGNGIFRSLDGGQTWTWLRKGLRHDNYGAYGEVWDIAIAPSKPTTLYAAVLDSPGPPGGPYPSARGGVYRSDDRGMTWVQTSCDVATSRVTALIVHPIDHRKVIASFEGGEVSFFPKPPLTYYPGGFFRSDDAGAHWTAATSGPAKIVEAGVWRLLRRGTGIYGYGLAGHDRPNSSVGLVVSRDDGATWTQLTTPLAGLFVNGFDVSADEQTILVNQLDGFKLHRSTNGGGSFSLVDTLMYLPAGPLVFAPDGQKLFYAANNALFRANGNLNDAEKVLEAPTFLEDIVFAPSDPKVAYATARGLRVYRSGDGGATWTAVGSLRADVIQKM